MTEMSAIPGSCVELTFQRGDQTLACKRWGREDQPLVLALHGWRDNAATFDRLAPLLPGWQILALDFAGHGLSSARHYDGAYAIWSYLDDVLEVLEQLQSPACHILGHSMGGAVGALFAALFPERVERLALLDIIGPLAVTPEDSVAQMRKSLLQKREWHPDQKSYYPTEEAAIMARANVGLEIDSAQLLANRGLSHDDGGYYWHTDRRLARANALSLSEPHVMAFLGKIACPTLFIQSSDRKYWDHLEAVFDTRVAGISQLQKIQLAGHHHQHLEGQVEAVATLVDGFLGASCVP